MDVTVVGSYDVITDNLFTIIISKESFIMTIKYSNRYSPEFKSSIMLLHKNNRSADFLAKEYNVSVSTVTKWMNQADPNNSKVPSDHEWALIEENRRLREELDILKRAACYWQKKNGERSNGHLRNDLG